MSYYEADYYRKPVPYTSSDVGEPVPGWGVNPHVAGPARVGVGATPMLQINPALLSALQSAQQPKTVASTASSGGATPPPPSPSKPMPWWVWPLGAAAGLGALGWYGTRKGWF